MRREFVIGAVLVVVVLLAAAAISLLAPPATETVAPDVADDPELFEIEGAEGAFWPYLDAQPDEFNERSPINVIVVGASTEEVIQLMRAEGDREWEETPEEERDVSPETFSAEEIEIGVEGTEIAWGDTTGTARYAYVEAGGSGEWIRESHHLHAGTYYGERTHIRLYDSPTEGEWVLMQVHTEHFDWFTLRHAVDGVAAGQRAVELDFMDQPFVESVWRMHLGNDGPSDADGWATVVELAAVLILVGSLSVGRLADRHLTPTDRRRIRAVGERLTFRHALLAGSIVALVLGVRVGGILLELYAGFLSMHAIAAVLFPFVAVGLPVAAYAIAAGMTRRIDAAVVASLSLAVAFLLDYWLVGVDVLPIEIVLHRVGVLFALGLIAGGAAERAVRETRLNGFVVIGLALWTLLLLSTLLGWI